MAGEYVEFVNNSQPALNEGNLNLMQQRIKQDIQGAVSGDTLPVGAIMPFGSDTIPENWLLCNGQAVSRTDYQQLFNTIGITFGQGDGFTTFNLPNLQGKVVVGKDENDEDFDMLGETGGEKEHTLTIYEMPEHNHTFKDGGKLIVPQGSDYGVPDYVLKNGQTITTSNAGEGEPHNILQPYEVHNYIIKAKQSAGVVATVVDSLNSTSTTDALSANQGRLLNEKIYMVLPQGSNINNLLENGKFGIFNATGTLPTGYSTSDNNIIIENIMWNNEYGRQILHDVRTTNTFIRCINGGLWQSWRQFAINTMT
jgi:microcystin-dependent protein